MGEFSIGLEFNFISQIAKYFGSPEDAFRLILSVVLGFPLAFLHRYFFYGKKPYLQHMYFICTGIFLGYFNFGWKVLHSLTNILSVHIILRIFGSSVVSVVLTFIVSMTYLCAGYYFNMTENYTIRWTMPHCVLTLRLISLAFDVHDGRDRKTSQQSSNSDDTSLAKTPSFLEIAGHAYFFGGFLVGPLYSIRRYLAFVNGEATGHLKGHKPTCVTPGFIRFALGIIITAVYQISFLYLPDSYLLSDQFQELSIIKRLIVIWLWGKFVLYKYLSVWLIAEGSCILTGLSYNGKDENGNELWDGCTNVRIWDYETSLSGQDIINSFNIQTNKWMAKYMFKRLKWMGNKDLSQLVTLAFLALWHGLYTGYFVNFSYEFLVMRFERQVIPLLVGSSTVKSALAIPGLSVVSVLLRKVYAQFVLSYALVSFCLFTADKYVWVYWQVYFIGHVSLILAFVAQYYISLHLQKSRHHKSVANGISKSS